MVAGDNYMLSFVGHSKVSTGFSIDGEVKAFPFDLQFETIEVNSYVANHETWHNFGVNDMRVFAWDDGVYLAILDQKLVDQHTHFNVMAVQRVLPVASATAVRLNLKAWVTSEHQWIPIDQVSNTYTGHADYLFARSIEPHQIVQCSHDGQCTEAAVTSHATFFEQLSGQHQRVTFGLGSNAVRVSNEHYGAILSGVRGAWNERKYVHFAYLFEAKYPWTIVEISRQPLSILPEPKCHKYIPTLCMTLVTGLTFVDGKLVISYSESDYDPKFFVSTVADVFRDMQPLGSSEFVLTSDMLLAQEHYVSALVEGPRHVDQGQRLQRLVDQHLRDVGHAAAQEEMTVFICGM